MLEIEAKIKVDSLDTVAGLLDRCDAKLLADLTQRDCYFDDPENKMSSGNNSLRIRRQISAGVEDIILTYKGKRGDSKFKSRPEHQVCVDDYDNMVDILKGLGYEISLSLEKRRQMWLLNGCEVSLDELPLLGYFVEVEGPSETQIAQTLKTLELSHLEHIQDGYAKLMKKRIKENGIETRCISFQGDEK